MIKLFQFFRRDQSPITQTEREWLNEITSRYSTLFQVAFSCPNCKQTQSVGQLQILGANLAKICQECVHCQKSIYAMKSGGRFIITPDNRVHRVFDFPNGVKE